jgi:alpha-galactosidase
VAADLYYSVFPKHDAIVRSVKITNDGSEQIVVMRLASLSIDLPSTDYDIIGLHGEWTRERSRNRRKVQPGIQGYAACFSNIFSIMAVCDAD